jgi:Sec-independent protein translocase protein TatA
MIIALALLIILAVILVLLGPECLASLGEALSLHISRLHTARHRQLSPPPETPSEEYPYR